jgi:hypothetical protein
MIKLLDKMRNNPRGDWTIADVNAVCVTHEIECIPSRSGSSHYKIKHRSQPEILTIPFKRPIKPVYIRKFVAFVDAVRSEHEPP